MQPVLSWLRQTTTVAGLATIALTAVLQFTSSAPPGVIASTFVGSLVLLILPGQGDLASKIATVASDAVDSAVARGSKASVGKLTSDAIVLAGQLHPATPVVVAGPAAVNLTQGA